MRNRLQILAALAALFLCMLGSTQAFATQPQLVWKSKKTINYDAYQDVPYQEFHKIDENIYTFRHSIHRTAAVITDEGVVVFDPLKPVAAEQLLKCIRMVTDKPIKYLIYSHNHYDHTRGSKVFKKAGALIVSHIDTKKWLEDNPHPEAAIPDMTWGTGVLDETWDLTIDDLVIRSHFMGPSHGVGMTAFFLPQKKLIHLVDVISPGRTPIALTPDLSPRGLSRSLNKLLEYDFEKVIAASEPSIVVGRGPVEDTALFYDILQINARTAIAKVGDDGSPWHFMQAIEPPHVTDKRFLEWQNYEEWWKGNILRAVVQERLGW